MTTAQMALMQNIITSCDYIDAKADSLVYCYRCIIPRNSPLETKDYIRSEVSKRTWTGEHSNSDILATFELGSSFVGMFVLLPGSLTVDSVNNGETVNVVMHWNKHDALPSPECICKALRFLARNLKIGLLYEYNAVYRDEIFQHYGLPSLEFLEFVESTQTFKPMTTEINTVVRVPKKSVCWIPTRPEEESTPKWIKVQMRWVRMFKRSTAQEGNSAFEKLDEDQLNHGDENNFVGDDLTSGILTKFKLWGCKM